MFGMFFETQCSLDMNLFNVLFLRAKAATALARLSHRNSVCPPVRPSHG